MDEKAIEEFFKTLGGGAAVIILGAVTVFSDKLFGRVKLALNRADLRIKQYEEMAIDLSNFVFQVELQHEFIKHDWNTDQITPDYNTSITAIRGKEFVYRAWVKRYWPGKEEEFSNLFRLIRKIDLAVHALNEPSDQPGKLDTLGGLIPRLREMVAKWLAAADT